ncbi:hypothetical protein JW968_00675 [Candidatus Woesearchaeota archaeon]|nr:hypothetical protein [Candidatus Woesearchaeota archaeon]
MYHTGKSLAGFIGFVICVGALFFMPNFKNALILQQLNMIVVWALISSVLMGFCYYLGFIYDLMNS